MGTESRVMPRRLEEEIGWGDGCSMTPGTPKAQDAIYSPLEKGYDVTCEFLNNGASCSNPADCIFRYDLGVAGRNTFCSAIENPEFDGVTITPEMRRQRLIPTQDQ